MRLSYQFKTGYWCFTLLIISSRSALRIIFKLKFIRLKSQIINELLCIFNLNRKPVSLIILFVWFLTKQGLNDAGACANTLPNVFTSNFNTGKYTSRFGLIEWPVWNCCVSVMYDESMSKKLILSFPFLFGSLSLNQFWL